MKKKITMFFLLSSIFLVSAFIQVSFAAPPVADWWGRLNLSGIMQNTTVVVEAFYTANNSHAVNSTLGLVDSGYYRLVAPCNPDDNLTFRVYGINVSLTYLCVQGSTTEFNLSVNTTANAGACQCYTGKDCSGTYFNNSGCTSGYCVHNTCRAASTYCGDSSCDSSNGETCTSCSGDCGACATTPTGGTTGGGGGGGAAAAVEVTKTVTSIYPETPATVTIEAAKAADLKVDEITLDVKEVVTNVQVTVKESSLPAGANVVISADAGTTYKYLDITTNVASTKIEKAKIKFKVEKSWTKSNNIDSGTVTLNRYADKKWNKLATAKTSEDSTYYYYEAETPGFSTFAVTGEKAKAGQSCGNNVKEGTEECDGTSLANQTCVSKGYASGTLACSSCKFDTSACVSAPAAVCGNNVKEGTEECDGTDLAGQTCKSEGFESGTLSCNNCKFDTSKCIAEKPPVTKPDYTTTYILVAIAVIAIALIVFAKKYR